MNREILLATSLITILPSSAQESAIKEDRPNVIVVMTDDQGIANLSCLGNPYIETPNIDKFYNQSIRLTDFHVSPLSTPTRSAITSSQYPIRNGAWATYKGRDILSPINPTMANAFQDAGYSTAMFGKWHLGDNYPTRPTDRGYEYAICHASGGVGELSDYWGNNYFDDTYLANNVPTKFEGYCTDVWFAEAEKYITKHASSNKPFFIYLATNAPHSPHWAPKEYIEPYEHLVDEGVIADAGYYGQIKNIDDNFGKFDQFLQDNNLAENTIVIFLTDNGAPPKDNPWTMGYRGGKHSPLEGGHRVPFFIRWYKAGVSGGVDIDGLASHVDLMPTLAGLCGFELSDNYATDGVDISKAILRTGDIPKGRSLFIHHRQDSQAPFDVNKSVVLRDQWRLINGKQLYDVVADRAQEHNIAEQHPDIVKSLLQDNAEFIAETKKFEAYQKLVPITVDTKHQEVVTLTIQHATGKGPGLWQPEQITAGVKNLNNGYVIEVSETGNYKIAFARWPRECQGTIGGIPSDNPKNQFNYQTITPQEARLVIDSNVEMIQKVDLNAKESIFEVELTAGRHSITTDFIEDGKPYGVYYTYISK